MKEERQMSKKLTIVVDSFDGYSDVWKTFFTVFSMQWPDCPYPIKLISNYMKYKNIDMINVETEICWSDRTLKALKRIDSKYVLLLLEDYLIGKKVNSSEIENALNYLEKRNGNYLRLTNIPYCRFNKSKERIFPLYADEEYAVNLQASIWKREYLINLLENFLGNAWQFEIGLLSNAVESPHVKLSGCYGMISDPLDVKNGVLKGKWFPSTLKYFEKRGVKINWQKRGKLSNSQELWYGFKFKLKGFLSYKERKAIKKLLKKCGIKFISDL